MNLQAGECTDSPVLKVIQIYHFSLEKGLSVSCIV